MSRHHANRGRASEDLVALVHAGYQRQGRAVCIRCNPPVRVLRQVRGGFVGHFIAEGPPDWTILTPTRTYVLDVKHAEEAPWPFASLEEHQARCFGAVERQGQTAAVLVQVGALWWWLPWSRLGPLWWEWFEVDGRAAPGTASLSLARLDEVGVRVPGGDWLGVVS